MWKSAFKHHHRVLLLYWTDLHIIATLDLWCSRPGDNQALVWSTQKRQDREVPGHRAPWQGLAAAAWRKWPGIRSSPHTCWKEPDLPGPLPWGAQLQALSASAWWGWCLRWYSRVPEESSLRRKHACAKSMADEGTESPQGLPQPGTLVHDANCSWHGWSHLIISPLVWLWAKLYRMTCCRHHEAVRPIHPCKTAACKYQHFKWQLRLEMDCTCFP